MIRRLFLALPLFAAIGAGSAHAQQCDTRFNFHNRSSTTVVEFFLTARVDQILHVTNSAPEPYPPARPSALLQTIPASTISGPCCRTAAVSICSGSTSAVSQTSPSLMPE